MRLLLYCLMLVRCVSVVRKMNNYERIHLGFVMKELRHENRCPGIEPDLRRSLLDDRHVVLFASRCVG